MSEIRKDPLSDRWVIVSKDRARRPDEFPPASARRVAENCPFCAGFERETPPPILELPRPGEIAERRWQVRVVPNKYPAFRPLEPGDCAEHSHTDLYECVRGVGAHEVIVESPEHLVSLTQLSDDDAQLVFEVYRERLRRLAEEPRLVYAQVFKNAGAAAGASIEHTHSQVIATPLMPANLQQEIDRLYCHWRRARRPLLAQMLELELAAETRIVAETPRAVAFCPYASRFGYEVWIAPREQQSRLRDADDALLGEVARLTRDVLRRLEYLLQKPAYNYYLRTAPLREPAASAGVAKLDDLFHWRVELFPRLARAAGFEWGTGYFINHTPPEEAAAALRDVRLG